MSIETNGLGTFMMINTIGMQILVNSLKASAYEITNDNTSRNVYKLKHYSHSVGSDSLAFIQGTGLEVMMNYYHIEYNADQLRNSLFYMFNRNDLIE